MAHRSEDSIPLSGKEINIKEWNDLRKIAISEKDIHLFHLETEDPYSTAEADAIVSNLNPATSRSISTGATNGWMSWQGAKARQVDESGFFSNMVLDGGPHLIDMAAEAKVFNF